MKAVYYVMAVSILSTTTISMAGERPSAAEREARREERIAKFKERQAERAEKKHDEQALAEKRKEYREKVARTTASEFEKKNSDKDILRGRVTYSVPAKDGDGYSAFVLLQWGDLDKKIPNIRSEYYSNWDGYVKVQGGGKAVVIREFHFDDRNNRTGGVDKGDGLGRDSGKKPGGPDRPGEGSGHDLIIKDTESSMVAWKSGVVGATDGLLIRLDLKKPEARGTIKAGNFSIPYEIQPRPTADSSEKTGRK